jgi:hypothetical protein
LGSFLCPFGLYGLKQDIFQLENLNVEESMKIFCKHGRMWTFEKDLKQLKAWPDLGKAYWGHMFYQCVTCRHTPGLGQVTAHSLPLSGQVLVDDRPRTLLN